MCGDELLKLNIKYFCKKNNISYEELSLKVGKKADYIKRYEDGKICSLRIDTVDKIAKVFQVEATILLTNNNFAYEKEE